MVADQFAILLDPVDRKPPAVITQEIVPILIKVDNELKGEVGIPMSLQPVYTPTPRSCQQHSSYFNLFYNYTMSPIQST